MANGISRSGRYGHLTVVPSKFEFKISPALAGMIGIEDIPMSFRVFNVVHFTTDDLISRPENGTLLLRAVTHYMERIAGNPAFLAPFIDNLRMGDIKTVIFKFAMNAEDREINLKIAGVKEDTPPMKTEVFLFSY